MTNSDDFVDFTKLLGINSQLNSNDDLISTKNSKSLSETKIHSKYLKDGKPIEYDSRTMEYYRVCRLRKMDPILCNILTDDTAFIFKYEWDPYTGERSIKKDPYGALYLDPLCIVADIVKRCLYYLWIPESDDATGVYQGYYGLCVGAGEEMFIKSRGYHPENYVFRLNYPDCYLTSDHNSQCITMGPKLTDDEIILIEKLARPRELEYERMFGSKMPSVVILKKFYDQAISKKPTIHSQITNNSNLQELYDQANRVAVDKLVEILR